LVHQISFLIVNLQNSIVCLVFELQNILELFVLNFKRDCAILIGSIVTETVLDFIEFAERDVLTESIDILLWGFVQVVKGQSWFP